MNNREDPNRPRLSGREYNAIRELFGLMSALEKYMSLLKRRAQLQPGCWRDLRLVETKLERGLEGLLRTLPAEKLTQVQKDLQNTQVTVEVKPPAGLPRKMAESFSYIPTQPLEKLIKHVMDYECSMCEKSEKEGRKCKWRQIIEDTFPYNLPQPDSEHCLFSWMGWVLGEDRTDKEGSAP